jgi:MFS family permease
VRSKRFGPALAVLFLVNVLNFYDRQALGAILEPLRHEFSLSDTQLGGLVTLFTVVFALAGMPLGKLADTRPRRGLLALGILVWTGLTGLAGLAANYWMLLGTRLGVGIGEAVCTPAATSWIGDLVPPSRRARAMAAFMTAVPVGVMLSLAISGPVAQAYGWRMAMIVAAAPGLLLAPAVMWLREPERSLGAGWQAEAPAPPMRPNNSPLVAQAVSPASYMDSSIPTVAAPTAITKFTTQFWWIAASGAVANFALYAFSTFLPALLTRYHGLSVKDAGIWTGLGSGISGILGAAAVGLLGDRVRNRLWLAAAAALLAAVPILAGIAMPAGQPGAAVMLAMSGYGLLQMYYGLVYAAIQDIVAPGMRGRAMAAYFMVTYLGGASWGPLITGRLSDWFAHRSGLAAEAARATGLHHAMYVIPALAVVLAAVLWQAGRSTVLPRDA